MVGRAMYDVVITYLFMDGWLMYLWSRYVVYTEELAPLSHVEPLVRGSDPDPHIIKQK
jgi:hypothetical protein